MKNDMQMVPYVKSGNTFTPKYPQHWDVIRPDENIDTSGNVVIECLCDHDSSKTLKKTKQTDKLNTKVVGANHCLKLISELRMKMKKINSFLL